MPPAPDLAGHALDGRYELHSIIGEGTFGRVYRGRDRRLARWVAVKVIKPWWAEDPRWAAGFEREAQLLASISHPGIVQIFDVGSAEEGLYYVAELVDGESLAGRLRRGPLAPEAARRIAVQLCEALACAHTGRIVHRDVKPENVLIAAGGQVKVGDFGVARLADASSDGVAATVAGTPRYMAPEQARGGLVAPATDVYGVGVVLYEMLSGRTPFEGRTAVELALAHLNDPPPPLPSPVPPALAAVVSTALAKDPTDRYADAGVMALALRSCDLSLSPVAGSNPVELGAEIPLVGPAGTRVGQPRSPRRNVNPSELRQRVGLFAVVLALGLALVGGAIALAPDRVSLPDMRGLTRARVTDRLRHLGLHPAFSERYSAAAVGSAVGQRPAPRVAVERGSTVRIVLSSGPPPVLLPQLVGRDGASASAILSTLKLRVRVGSVPAPGATTGDVVALTPSPGTSVPSGSLVRLDLAQAPQWRPLTSLSGESSTRSLSFLIRGHSWRIVTSMSYEGVCTFVFFCSGPSLRVSDPASGRRLDGFGLPDASNQAHVLTSGPAPYRVTVSPGSDTARWSIEIQDRY